jgi:hypothetical protein
MIISPPEVELLSDVSPAAWVIEGLRSWGRDGVPVTSIVPEGFHAYARIEHPDDSMEGEVLPETMGMLVPILEDFTTTPDGCFFCVWDGWGFWFQGSHAVMTPDPEMKAAHERASAERDRIMKQAPLVKAQARDYFLFHGPLSAASSLAFDGFDQSPNLWWPDDRAWCVGTEIDLKDTYVGASRECIERLVATPDLNASQVEPGDDVNQLHPW